MSVKMTTRQVGDVTVVDAVGRITLGDGASTFRDTIRDLSAGGKKKLLLNLTKRVKDLLQITKLYTVFEVFEDEAAAVRSYS